MKKPNWVDVDKDEMNGKEIFTKWRKNFHKMLKKSNEK